MKFSTPCKNCIFATYENNTQVGCFTEALTHLKNNGANVVEAYDEDKEFFVIENRICINCRDKDKWLPYHEGNLDELYTQVKEENLLKVEALILFNIGNNLFQLEKTLQFIQHNKKFFSKIHIVNSTGFTPYEIRHLIHKITKKIPWGIESMVDNVDLDKMVHYGLMKITENHTLILEVGEDINNDCVVTLNSLIKQKMIRIAIVKPLIDNSYHGLFFNTSISKALGTLASKNLLDNITQQATEDKSLDLIYTWTQIYQE